MSEQPFWEKPLHTLSQDEWESLCDGCGRCCLKKLIDEETEQLAYTRVVCRYFDQQSSRCTSYESRTDKVPDCLQLSEHNIDSLKWMPDTCAYKLRHEGKPLFDWHPLIAGSRGRMEALGITIAGRVLSEDYVHENGLAEHLINWVASDG